MRSDVIHSVVPALLESHTLSDVFLQSRSCRNVEVNLNETKQKGTQQEVQVSPPKVARNRSGFVFSEPRLQKTEQVLNPSTQSPCLERTSRRASGARPEASETN